MPEAPATLPPGDLHPPRALRPWRAAAWTLAAPTLGLAVALAWPGGVAGPWREALQGAVTLGAVGLAALVLGLLRRLARGSDEARALTRDQQTVLDALPYGIVLWDAHDRLQLSNADFRRLYGEAADLQAGSPFETLLRQAVQRGRVPEAVGREDAWLAERLQAHAAPDGQPRLRQLADGRWREIVEQRLPDGRLLAHSVDVTARVEREQALAQAQREAALATQRLHDAIEALPAGFELYDAEDRLLIVNRPMRALYPLIDDLADARPSFDTVVRTHHARGGLDFPAGELDDYIARRQAERHAGATSRLVRMASGAWVRSHEHTTREGGVVGVRIDVTELVQQRAAAEDAQRQAELARARLDDAIEALPEGFTLFDAEDRLVICNRRYREIYAATAEMLQTGVRFEDMLRAGLAVGQYPQAVGRESEWLAERLQAHRQPQGAVLQELPGNRWLRIDERRTREGGVAGVRTDVTELVRRGQALQALNEQLDRLNAELRQLSDTDPLTGLANRRLLQRRLAEEVARSQRHGVPLALLSIDVDHFKRYNDRHGHPAGDACLLRMAGLLTAQARRPADLAARTGGEEFALLLPHTARDEAMAMAQRLLQAVDAADIAHGDSPTAAHVTVSVGVACWQPGEDVPALLQAADAALYAAKTAGRHRALAAGG